MTVVLMRSKTGRRLHLGSPRSSRTLCGVRGFAVRSAHPNAEFCGTCGIPPEATPASINEWLQSGQKDHAS